MALSKTFALETEMLAAAARLPFSAVRQLGAMGADLAFVARLTGAGLLGIGQVALSAESWEPDGPDRRLLLAVLDAGTIVDIAALSSTRRDEWALRTGLGWALGANVIEDAHRALITANKPIRLRLHATPFDWLAAGGAGMCVLDWSAAALTELRLLGERVTIEAPSKAVDQLKGMLAYGGLPRVTASVPWQVGEAA